MTAPALAIALAALAANRNVSPITASAGNKNAGQAAKQPNLAAAKAITKSEPRDDAKVKEYERIVLSFVFTSRRPTILECGAAALAEIVVNACQLTEQYWVIAQTRGVDIQSQLSEMCRGVVS